ncbi:MAG: glycine-rich protein [Marmoricola sp.]
MSRTSGLRLPALALSTTLSLSGLVVLTAAPATAAPTPVCDDTTCTVTYTYTGAAESFTVPRAVTELDVSVSGAAGGDARQEFSSTGGQGGFTRATMSATPGTSLEVLVGGAGSTAGGASVGGGGATSPDSYLGSGGGGSFIFRDDGTPAVISGGGGGGAGINWGPVNGGHGAGAGFSGADGSTEPFYNPSTPARGGSSSAGGAGSTNRVDSNGLAGTGPSANSAPGVGGRSGSYSFGGEYDGGGGGGGYYGGGGGGYADAGAGGSGYTAPGVVVISSTVGGRSGNGVVTIAWTRNKPTVAATLSSAIAPTAAGWYRRPVTITYTCTPADDSVTCPAPVTVSSEGAAQNVTGTATAADGGVATANSVVNLDRTAPGVRVTGVRDNVAYLGAKPRYSCRSVDRLSGVASCRVTAAKRAHGPTVLKATAADRAGNVATRSVSYWVKHRVLAGATWKNGAWEVQRGRTYTLAAMAWHRPRFFAAVPGNGTPSHFGARFKRAGKAAGVKRWTRRVTMSMPVSRSRTWTLGVQDRRGLHGITFRIVGQ